MKNTELTELTELTPLMRQYWSIKSAHKDKLVFFRMGDFFEMFHQDAETAAPILGIALTCRNKKAQNETKMCGVPHHSVAVQINKLLAAGHKVAICDQVEDPRTAKGIVKREITRILSPGMVYDPESLDHKKPHYLSSLDSETISFLDVTTGEAFYFKSSDLRQRIRLLEVLQPTEIVDSSNNIDSLKKELTKYSDSVNIVNNGNSRHHWSIHDNITLDHLNIKDSEILKHFSTHLQNDANDSNNTKAYKKILPISAQRLLSYVVTMQGEDVLKTISDFEERPWRNCLYLSETVLKHLEIFTTYNGNEKKSFFSAINRTAISGGARLLKKWILFPLTDINLIRKRQNRIAYWNDRIQEIKIIRQTLSGLGDLERRIGKLSQPHCNSADLVSLRNSLEKTLQVYDLTINVEPETKLWSKNALETANEIILEIKRTLVEEPPLNVKTGSIICSGYSKELFEIHRLTNDSQQLLCDLETREKSTTGISSLKVRYNNVFGYYIEVTHTHINKVPSHYIRKQTLTNAERYTTDELSNLEGKILSARSRREDLEMEIFRSLKQFILDRSSELLILANHLNELDVVISLAWLAYSCRYTKPNFIVNVSNNKNLDSGSNFDFNFNSNSDLSSDYSYSDYNNNANQSNGNGNSNGIGNIELKASRHPVVEQDIKMPFVANDIMISSNQCLLLTGPNMAGKSTLMRQVALSAILAQMGSFVPADKAILPVFDQIFTRIGASDSITDGLSTFMVEMKETSDILKNATSQSLVILDEIGRGTSTYDGMSLAQAILEYFLTEVKSITLFATHYHELTKLEHSFSNCINAHMSIRDYDDNIDFLYTLRFGPANKSYGIQVAQLAGLPESIIKKANIILRQLENSNKMTGITTANKKTTAMTEAIEMTVI